MLRQRAPQLEYSLLNRKGRVILTAIIVNEMQISTVPKATGGMEKLQPGVCQLSKQSNSPGMYKSLCVNTLIFLLVWEIDRSYSLSPEVRSV